MNQMLIDQSPVLQQGVNLTARNVDVFCDDTHAVKSINMEIPGKTATASIGPSGCGKSTYRRCLNRMKDTIQIHHATGEILLDGDDRADW